MEMKPRDLLRKREKEYKELGLSDPSISDDQIIDAMVGHPRLIERPIVTSGDRVVLGRPIERVLEVVD
jgi:arsenate reductase